MRGRFYLHRHAMRFNRDAFWEKYRAKFGRVNQSQVDAIEFLLSKFETDTAWKNVKEIAYALATIKHETAHTFKPIYEKGGKSYFNKYDGRADLGNKFAGDGYLYRGRGFVQLTGRKNYTKYGIANDPDKALEPLIAFRIMSDGMHKGVYTGKKLSDFISNSRADYRNARKVINGLDKAAQIAAYAEKFEDILSAAANQQSSGHPQSDTQSGFSELTGPSAGPGEDTTTSGGVAIQPPIDSAPPGNAVNVPPVVTETEQGIVSKVKAWYAAAPAALLSFGGGVWSWIQGAATEIIIAFFATSGAIAISWISGNLLLKNKREQREHEAKEKQRERDFELTKLQLQSAMDPNKQTVLITPPPTEIPNADH